MMKYLFFPFFLFISTPGFCQFSEIKGKVESRRNGDTMASASVSCTGNGHHYNTTTDPDGEFKFRNLAMGTYDITIEY
ncbi:MAG TPA: carboxypeptidase-like regulatory domain-containing protein, partial [Puia sp.]